MQVTTNLSVVPLLLCRYFFGVIKALKELKLTECAALHSSGSGMRHGCQHCGIVDSELLPVSCRQEHPRDWLQRRCMRRQLFVPSRGRSNCRSSASNAASMVGVPTVPEVITETCAFPAQADIDACVEYIKGCAKRARGSWRDALRISEYVQGDHLCRIAALPACSLSSCSRFGHNSAWQWRFVLG